MIENLKSLIVILKELEILKGEEKENSIVAKTEEIFKSNKIDITINS